MGRYCQQKKHVVVERLDKFNNTEDEWLEIVVEDKQAGRAEVARVRLKFTACLMYLPNRLRRIAKLLTVKPHLLLQGSSSSLLDASVSVAASIALPIKFISEARAGHKGTSGIPKPSDK
jgi:hypothetical protein